MTNPVVAQDEPTRPRVRRDAEWQAAVGRAIRDPAELRRRLGLPSASEHDQRAQDAFPVFVPLEYLSKIEPGNPSDPLLLQVLPTGRETQVPADARIDAVGDAAAQQQPGLLQKYANRALFMPTMNCAVHCRYCFRRNYLSPDFFQSVSSDFDDGELGDRVVDRSRRPAENATELPARWAQACRTIDADPSINEVILSGGDPLMLGDSPLRRLVERLGEIQHLRVLRIHTRLPVMIPSRINAPLVKTLQATPMRTILVLHANHPREIDDAARSSLQRLQQAGVLTLNQSVLLRGVNDSSETLKELSHALIQAGVLPYYLHQLDRAAGVTHFEVPVQDGLTIIEQLRQQLPGYAVPRYVREVSGAPHKIPLS